MSRKALGDRDLERGRRFSKILDKIFPNMSRRSIAAEFGLHGTRISNMEKGVSIDNKVLAELSKRMDDKSDLFWLLSGTRAGFDAAACANITAAQVQAVAMLSKMMDQERDKLRESSETLVVLFQTISVILDDPAFADQLSDTFDQLSIEDLTTLSRQYVRPDRKGGSDSERRVKSTG